jgi:hypothetical protein
MHRMTEDKMKFRRRALKFLAIVIGATGYYIAPTMFSLHTLGDLLQAGFGIGLIWLGIWIWLEANELAG